MTREIKESAGGTERGESRSVALLYTRPYSVVGAMRVMYISTSLSPFSWLIKSRP